MNKIREPGVRSPEFAVRSPQRHCIATPGSWRLTPLILFLFTAQPLPAADAITWRTGRDMQQALDRYLGPAGLTWSGQTIRDGLGNLSRASGVRVAMLIDRRIDPGKKLTLSIGDVALDEALGRIAAAVDGEHCRVGSVIYFGPSATARRLRTVAELRKEELRKLPAANAKRLTQAKALEWDDLAEPRAILAELAKSGGCWLANPGAVPHDLWGAAELPIMTLADRITLVAGAYDLTFEVAEDAKSIRLVPIPERVAVRRTYAGGQNASEKAKQIAAAFVNCEVTVTGTKIQVEGRVEDQLLVAAALAGKEVKKPARPPPVALERAGVEWLDVKNHPLGALLKEVAARFNLEVSFDGAAIKAAGVSLDQIVSISVKNITVKQLFEKLTEPYGLEYEIKEKQLIVRPRKN